MYREQAKTRVRTQAEERAEDRILDALLPRRTAGIGFDAKAARNEPPRTTATPAASCASMLRAGELDDREIELELAANVGVDIMTPPGMEEMGQQLRQMFSQHRRRQDRRRAR